LPYFSVIFDNDITDFYSWTIPKNDCLIVGSALPQKDDTNNRFELLKKKMLDYGYNFKQRIKREGSFIYRPTKLKQLCFGVNRIGLVGEAAGLISPSSAEGISYALKSACNLADAILLDSNNFLKHYKQSMAKMKINILLKNLKSPFMYNSILRKVIMTFGLNSEN
jgi:flavin-dependent dehydrogenase